MGLRNVDWGRPWSGLGGVEDGEGAAWWEDAKTQLPLKNCVNVALSAQLSGLHRHFSFDLPRDSCSWAVRIAP